MTCLRIKGCASRPYKCRAIIEINWGRYFGEEFYGLCRCLQESLGDDCRVDTLLKHLLCRTQ
jgi:hypothetical protein